MRIAFSEYHRYDAVLRVGSHQLATELRDRGHRLAWLPHARSWLHRLRGERPPPERVVHGDGVVEVTLGSLAPYVDLPVLGSAGWGRRWLDVGVDNRSTLERAGLDRVDLLWISDFTMMPLIDLLPAERVVLRFFDHLREFRWMPRSILTLVRHYLERVDLVLASSRDVQAALAEEGIEAAYLPNGADVRRLRPLPPEGERERRVIYVGALEEWFDLETVEVWARALPDVRFEIVGPNRAGLASSLENVEIAGPVPYERLPEVLARARVGIIPFHRTRLTRGVHPLKMYDYLGAGCSVLSSDLPEVEARPEGVFVYRDADEGLGILRRELDRAPDRDALRGLARASSWSARLDRVEDLLGISLAGAGGAA